MAGRPPLPIGSHGKIATRKFGDGYQARCRYRDADGQTRMVAANGSTRAAAERNLQTALLRRPAAVTDDLSGDNRFSAVIERWFEGLRSAVASGERSPSTITAYRRVLDCHVLPALGQLKLREVTTTRVDRFLCATRDNAGAATARTCRTVISQAFEYARRSGAVNYNATQGTTPLSGKPRKQPRALTRDERARWISQLAANPTAVRKDLPDLTSFMLGTGVRIGEALAVSWDEIDFDAATVAIAHTMVRVKGQGLLRKSTKTAAGERVLPLPPLVVAMLRKRLRAGRIGATPVFPDSHGGWRDPYNTSRDLRNARGTDEFAWVTSHVFRKTAATMLDEAGLSARQIANLMGHSKVSMTQDFYMGRGTVDRRAAEVLGEGLGEP